MWNNKSCRQERDFHRHGRDWTSRRLLLSYIYFFNHFPLFPFLKQVAGPLFTFLRGGLWWHERRSWKTFPSWLCFQSLPHWGDWVYSGEKRREMAPRETWAEALVDFLQNKRCPLARGRVQAPATARTYTLLPDNSPPPPGRCWSDLRGNSEVSPTSPNFHMPWGWHGS